jgi:hypothetical protein
LTLRICLDNGSADNCDFISVFVEDFGRL